LLVIVILHFFVNIFVAGYVTNH